MLWGCPACAFTGLADPAPMRAPCPALPMPCQCQDRQGCGALTVAPCRLAAALAAAPAADHDTRARLGLHALLRVAARACGPRQRSAPLRGSVGSRRCCPHVHAPAGCDRHLWRSPHNAAVAQTGLRRPQYNQDPDRAHMPSQVWTCMHACRHARVRTDDEPHVVDAGPRLRLRQEDLARLLRRAVVGRRLVVGVAFDEVRDELLQAQPARAHAHA